MGVVRELLFLSKNKQNHIQDELFEGCSKVVRRGCSKVPRELPENRRKSTKATK